jgi:hypothetical protein
VQISWLTATGTLVLDIFLEVEFTDYQKLNINEIILSQKKILISDLPLYQILFKINKRKAKKRKNENKSL